RRSCPYSYSRLAGGTVVRGGRPRGESPGRTSAVSGGCAQRGPRPPIKRVTALPGTKLALCRSAPLPYLSSAILAVQPSLGPDGQSARREQGRRECPLESRQQQ